MHILRSLVIILYVVLAALCIGHRPSLAEDPQPAAKNPDPSYSSVEERRILSKIEDNQTETAAPMTGMKEKELKSLNEAADKKLEEINQKLEELRNLQKNLKVEMAKKNIEEAKRIKELGKIYEKMAPDKAALSLSNMDDKLATNILATMKPRSAAKVLNALDRKKASELSTVFTTAK